MRRCGRATTVNFGVRKGRIPEATGEAIKLSKRDEPHRRWLFFPRQYDVQTAE